MIMGISTCIEYQTALIARCRWRCGCAKRIRGRSPNGAHSKGESPGSEEAKYSTVHHVKSRFQCSLECHKLHDGMEDTATSPLSISKGMSITFIPTFKSTCTASRVPE